MQRIYQHEFSQRKTRVGLIQLHCFLFLSLYTLSFIKAIEWSSMHKLKTTFLRTHSTRPSDERRSLQFARKLNAAQLTAFDDPNSPNAIPSLRPDELCEMERIAYQTWWKDLDPFSIGHLDNEALLKFVRGCCLPEVKLEQVHFCFRSWG